MLKCNKFFVHFRQKICIVYLFISVFFISLLENIFPQFSYPTLHVKDNFKNKFEDFVAEQYQFHYTSYGK